MIYLNCISNEKKAEKNYIKNQHEKEYFHNIKHLSMTCGEREPLVQHRNTQSSPLSASGSNVSFFRNILNL